MSAHVGAQSKTQADPKVGAERGSEVGAEADERALQLLEGMQPTEPWASLAVDTVETAEMIVVMVSHEMDDVETRTRSVFDYVGRRADRDR